MVRPQILIDYIIVNRKLTGSIEDTRVYRSAVTDIKSRDYHLVVSRVYSKLKFWKGNYHSKVMMLIDC